MGLIATDSGGKAFTPVPAGTHLAVCAQVIDLGHQESTFYQKVQHKVLLGWELPDEKDEKGTPFLIWKRYTLSLNEKATLRHHLEAWRGRKFTEDELKGFDLKNVLGKPCMICVVHNKEDNKTYADVSSVMALPKGTVVPETTHPKVHFSLDEWDQGTFDAFSPGLKKVIDSSEERKKKANAAPAPAGAMATLPTPSFDDDNAIPF